MTCMYSDFEGKCNLFDPSIDNNLCCDEEGNCTCEEDEDPGDVCESFDNEEETWDDDDLDE